MIWGAGVYLADSEAEAMRRLEPAHDERFKWFAPFGFVRYADEHGRTLGLARRAGQGADACGRREAEGVVLRTARAGDRRASGRWRTKYPGLDNFMIHWAEGLGPKEFKEQLRWFAKDVMPAFKKRG